MEVPAASSSPIKQQGSTSSTQNQVTHCCGNVSCSACDVNESVPSMLPSYFVSDEMDQIELENKTEQELQCLINSSMKPSASGQCLLCQAKNPSPPPSDDENAVSLWVCMQCREALPPEPCSCFSCEERAYQEATEEAELSKSWQDLRNKVRCVYRDAGMVEHSVRLAQIDATKMKQLVDRLCLHDAHQLFIRLESLARQHVHECRTKLLSEKSCPNFLTELLSCYNRLCSAGVILAGWLAKLERDHLSQFKLTWELLNKHLFEAIIYQEASQRLPELMTELRASPRADGLPSLLHNYMRFDEEMAVISVIWRQSLALLHSYTEQQNMLRIKQHLIHQDWNFFKAQRLYLQRMIDGRVCSPGSGYVGEKVSVDERASDKEQNCHGKDFVKSRRKESNDKNNGNALSHAALSGHDLKQRLKDKCPDCHLIRACHCHECSLAHALICSPQENIHWVIGSNQSTSSTSYSCPYALLMLSEICPEKNIPFDMETFRLQFEKQFASDEENGSLCVHYDHDSEEDEDGVEADVYSSCMSDNVSEELVSPVKLSSNGCDIVDKRICNGKSESKAECPEEANNISTISLPKKSDSSSFVKPDSPYPYVRYPPKRSVRSILKHMDSHHDMHYVMSGNEEASVRLSAARDSCVNPPSIAPPPCMCQLCDTGSIAGNPYSLESRNKFWEASGPSELESSGADDSFHSLLCPSLNENAASVSLSNCTRHSNTSDSGFKSVRSDSRISMSLSSNPIFNAVASSNGSSPSKVSKSAGPTITSTSLPITLNSDLMSSAGIKQESQTCSKGGEASQGDAVAVDTSENSPLSGLNSTEMKTCSVATSTSPNGDDQLLLPTTVNATDDGSIEQWEEGSNNSDSSDARDGKYCDCCYCELLGHSSPAAAPTSKNYTEMRDRLRQQLQKRKERHPSSKTTVASQGKVTEAKENLPTPFLINSVNSNISSCNNKKQQYQNDQLQPNSINEKHVEEILKFIEGNDDSKQSTKSAKRARQRQKKQQAAKDKEFQREKLLAENLHKKQDTKSEAQSLRQQQSKFLDNQAINKEINRQIPFNKISEKLKFQEKQNGKVVVKIKAQEEFGRPVNKYKPQEVNKAVEKNKTQDLSKAGEKNKTTESTKVAEVRKAVEKNKTQEVTRISEKSKVHDKKIEKKTVSDGSIKDSFINKTKEAKPGKGSTNHVNKRKDVAAQVLDLSAKYKDTRTSVNHLRGEVSLKSSLDSFGTDGTLSRSYEKGDNKGSKRKEQSLAERMEEIAIVDENFGSNQGDNNKRAVKKKRRKNGKATDIDEIFRPKDNTSEMNDMDKEIEAFKRFCSVTVPKREKIPVAVNVKDIFSKKKPGISCA